MIPLLQPEPASNERAEPPCPHFGACAGCQLQHLTYATQLERKAAYLRNLLGESAPPITVHASPPLGYRNRIRLTVQKIDGQLRAGYLQLHARPDANDAARLYATGEGPDEPLVASKAAKASFLPITECPIAAPILWRATEAFLELAGAADWLNTPNATPDQLELFTTADEAQLNLTLYLRTTARELPSRTAQHFAALCDALSALLPQLTGAGISLLPSSSATRSRRTEIPRPAASWGKPGLNYTIPLAEHEPTIYWVPRGSFFQVNRFLLPELLATVLHAANVSEGNSLAWDLYAGAGLFSRPLAQRFSSVTAVEIAEPAATALAQPKLANLRAVKATTLDFLRNAVVERDRPDVVLLDPPRTGAGTEVCNLLGRIAAPHIVYVSCSPTHFAQELELFGRHGYEIASLDLFDLFPQTEHLETVAVLARRS